MGSTEEAEPTPSPLTLKRRLLRWAGVVAAFVAAETASGYFKKWGESLRTSGADEKLLLLLGTGLLYLGAALRQMFWPAVFAAIAYWLALRQIRKESARTEDAVIAVAMGVVEHQERLTKEQVAKLRAELRPPLNARAVAKALRRGTEEERNYQAWVRRIVESLVAGPGNFIKIGPDEHAWAARAVREGRLRWGPIGDIPGVMLPENQ